MKKQNKDVGKRKARTTRKKSVASGAANNIVPGPHDPLGPYVLTDPYIPWPLSDILRWLFRRTP